MMRKKGSLLFSEYPLQQLYLRGNPCELFFSIAIRNCGKYNVVLLDSVYNADIFLIGLVNLQSLTLTKCNLDDIDSAADQILLPSLTRPTVFNNLWITTPHSGNSLLDYLIFPSLVTFIQVETRWNPATPVQLPSHLVQNVTCVIYNRIRTWLLLSLNSSSISVHYIRLCYEISLLYSTLFLFLLLSHHYTF